MNRVAIATCQTIPEPDVDEPLLMSALAAAGIDAHLVPWDDPGVDWGTFDLTVIRSTWNYIQNLAAFTAWADAVPRLLNPAAIVRWNSHKEYLDELAAKGLPTVPTAFMHKGDPRPLAQVMTEYGWEDVVAKPTVGAGSFLTERVHREDLPAAEAFWHRLITSREAMVQPYLKSVEDYGERSLMWIDGEFTHAIRKNPRLAGEDESVSGPMEIGADERELATRSLTFVDAELLYARVDLIRGDQGQPLLAELELVEPSLFLQQSPRALERLVTAIARRLTP